MTIRTVAGTRLSPREEQVLGFIRHSDMSYAQIGLELGIAGTTVAVHAKRGFCRLGVYGRVGYLRSLVEPAHEDDGQAPK